MSKAVISPLMRRILDDKDAKELLRDAMNSKPPGKFTFEGVEYQVKYGPPPREQSKSIFKRIKDWFGT